jgi:signal transduction histidine kinase
MLQPKANQHGSNDERSEAAASQPPATARVLTRRTLSRRFLIGFLAVAIPGVVILGAVTIYSIASLVSVNQRLDDISVSLDGIRQLQAQVSEIAPLSNAYLLHNHQGTAPKLDGVFAQKLDGVLKSARRTLAGCAAAFCHESRVPPHRMAEMLAPELDALRTKAMLVLKRQPSQVKAASAPQLEDIDDLAHRISGQLRKMSSVLVPRANALRQESRALGQRASVLTVAVALLVLAFGSGAAMVLGEKLSRPIQELLRGTRRIRAGDWGYRVPVRDSGEAGELASSFNAMVDELRDHRDKLNEYSRTLEERVRARTEELERRDKVLRRSEKLASLGLLASGVAHELNNPLTSILMNVNLMMEDAGENSPLYGDLKKIDQDVNRCRRIISDLRVFSRPQEKVEKKTCPARTIVDQAVRLVGYDLERRGVQVEQEMAADLPEIFCDPEQITRVLANLLINAGQAMGERGRLSVSAHKRGSQLVIEIHDNGCGIPSKYRSRIFDPFFTTKPDGTGLGLFISYGIVEEHGGEIEVESLTQEEAGPEGESGTTVRVLLPLWPEADAQRLSETPDPGAPPAAEGGKHS